MKEIIHDLNESAQMFAGAAWWLGQENMEEARGCIKRAKQLIEKAELAFRTETLLKQVDEMNEPKKISGIEEIDYLLKECEKLMGE